MSRSWAGSCLETPRGRPLTETRHFLAVLLGNLLALALASASAPAIAPAIATARGLATVSSLLFQPRLVLPQRLAFTLAFIAWMRADRRCCRRPGMRLDSLVRELVVAAGLIGCGLGGRTTAGGLLVDLRRHRSFRLRQNGARLLEIGRKGAAFVA